MDNQYKLELYNILKEQEDKFDENVNIIITIDEVNKKSWLEVKSKCHNILLFLWSSSFINSNFYCFFHFDEELMEKVKNIDDYIKTKLDEKCLKCDSFRNKMLNIKKFKDLNFKFYL